MDVVTGPSPIQCNIDIGKWSVIYGIFVVLVYLHVKQMRGFIRGWGEKKTYEVCHENIIGKIQGCSKNKTYKVCHENIRGRKMTAGIPGTIDMAT